MILFLSLILCTIIGALIWRALCAYYNLPWPYFLAFWLENPYMKIFANPQHFINVVNPNEKHRILEIGSGAGRILLRAAKQTSFKADFVGIDLQKNMVALARKKVQKIEKKEAKAKTLKLRLLTARFTKETLKEHPWLNQNFDQVYLVTVLGEVPDKVALLKNAKQTLAPGGSIFVQEVIPDPCYVFSSTLVQYADSAGLKVISTRHGLFQYISELK
jgi:ubiquinone/menaquinone biosynthesis C-methylase UbiE